MAKKRSRRSGITAEELVQQLEADPAFQARQAREESERTIRREASLARQRPVMVELHSLGIRGEGTWDVIGQLEGLPGAAEAVIKLISVAEHDLRPREWEGLIRALGFIGNDAIVPRLIVMHHDEGDRNLKIAYQSSILGGLDGAHFDSIIVSIEQGFSRRRFPRMLVEGIAELRGPGVRQAERRVKDTGVAPRLMRAVDRFRAR